MFKNKLPALLLATALLLSPTVARAERYEREHHRHQHHFSVQFGIGPGYYGNGYYDRWDRWHPHGYYDRWGFWHPYPYPY